MKKILSMAVLGMFLSHGAQAGGPFVVNESGEAARWQNGNVDLHPESGTCATFSNNQMVTKLQNNMAHWTDITGISLDIDINDGVIDEDVDGDNYNDYFVDSASDEGLNDGLNPVVFDEDASIVGYIFGTSNRFAVLGFAGPDGFASGFETIVDGQAFFNCRCLAGSGFDCGGVEFTEDDLDFTMVHEIGHMIGFDHTQVNQDIAESVDGCDPDNPGDCDDIPTMYPEAVDSGDQITPHRDDEVSALTLYGSSTWESDTFTVTGSLVDQDGEPLRCADVQAETGDPADTIAVVSGAFAPATDLDGDGYTDGEGECLSDCGDFVLRGLDPSKTYTITVKPVDSQWVSGSSISPCGSDPTRGGTGQLTGIELEEIADDVSATGGATISLGVVTSDSQGGVTEGDAEEVTSLSCSLSASAKGSNMPYWVLTLAAMSFLAAKRRLSV